MFRGERQPFPLGGPFEDMSHLMQRCPVLYQNSQSQHANRHNQVASPWGFRVIRKLCVPLTSGSFLGLLRIAHVTKQWEPRYPVRLRVVLIRKRRVQTRSSREMIQDLQEEPKKCSSYGDLTAMSNPAAGSICIDSSSPLQALRKFARTPDKTVVTPKKEEEEEEEEEEKEVKEEVEMEENISNSNEEPETSDQTPDPSPDSTNKEVRMVRTCLLGEAKAREACSKVIVQYPVEEEHSEDEAVPDETDEDEVSDNTQSKSGCSNVESPIPTEQVL
ncbi:hypothetical protein NDU88_005523 [Pleurodeles waltl]|uniref:Uncharacterized protein n=1 Tax=Pleurodeles waltl TaxID=8319 RepID=A0AAV7TB17_PLEWA|nr:hypothetical protein NDU88_005523 [Pleurodeles waltl]